MTEPFYRTIMQLMNDIGEIFALLKEPSDADKKIIEKSYLFAQKAHEGQLRYSGEPYFNHLFETAKNLAILGMGAKTIAAGFLHDVLEDADVSEEILKKEFDGEILFLVQGVTKLGKIRYRGVERHTESLRKLFVAMSQDIRVLIIKLADRLHNMKTLQYVPKEKQRRIAAETLEIYAPIAYRLGISRLNRELEDLAFPYVFPKEYREVKDLLKQKQKEDLSHLEKFHKHLKKALAKKGVTYIRTEYRIKGIYSLYKKLVRKGKDIEKIYDISAIRIIVPTISDCYKVLGIVHGIWRPLPGRIKDYIAFPKPNGYQSIHTTIFTGDGSIVEVQIKTEDMYRESEYGIASHISYKEEKQKRSAGSHFLWIQRLLPSRPYFGSDNSASKVPESLAGLVKNHPQYSDIPGWIKELVQYQRFNNANEKDFEENLKTDFFEERIFVFTPKGDVVDLPKESSPVDFAYAIHSDIGNHIAGAKVNGKFVALNTKLENGDIIEVQTKGSSQPSPKWLDFVKTTLAQKNIRTVIQEKNG